MCSTLVPVPSKLYNFLASQLVESPLLFFLSLRILMNNVIPQIIILLVFHLIFGNFQEPLINSELVKFLIYHGLLSDKTICLSILNVNRRCVNAYY